MPSLEYRGFKQRKAYVMALTKIICVGDQFRKIMPDLNKEIHALIEKACISFHKGNYNAT